VKKLLFVKQGLSIFFPNVSKNEEDTTSSPPRKSIEFQADGRKSRSVVDRNGNARCRTRSAMRGNRRCRYAPSEKRRKSETSPWGIPHSVRTMCARCEPEGETCARCKTGSGIIRASKDTRLIVGERDNSARFAYVSLSVRPGGASAGQLAITD